MKYLLLLLIFISSVARATEEPSIKKLSLGMVHTKACSLINSWHKKFSLSIKEDAYIQNMPMEHTSCSIEHGVGIYQYDTVWWNNKTGKVVKFQISSQSVDSLFGVSDLDKTEFAQMFVDSFEWISELKYRSSSRQIEGYYFNSPNGWSIFIANNKEITLTKTKVEKRSFN